MSEFRLQVVDAEGRVVASWRPGDTPEVDFIQRVADRVAAKPVGVLHTAAAVRAHVVASLREVLYELKASVKPR